TRIEMATDVVARTATAKEVTAGHRLYGLVGQGAPGEQDLAYAYDMAAMGQELQPHLSAQLKRVSPGEQQGEQNKSPGDSGTGTLVPLPGPTGQGRPARGLGVCQVLAGRRPTGRHAGGEAASREPPPESVDHACFRTTSFPAYLARYPRGGRAGKRISPCARSHRPN